MSDEEAKFKGDTLAKFKNEQSIRIGGSKAQVFSAMLGFGFYI